jgi:hypothetical protein
MSKPWEEYQSSAPTQQGQQSGPWESYATEEKSLAGFGENAVNSAVEFGTDFIQMPKDVLTMAADLGIDTWGAVFNGGEIDVDTDNPTAAGFKALMTEEGRAALGEYYADRYGGMDNFQNSLYEDPVGVISDIAMIAMPAMAAKNIAKGASKVGVKGADSVADAFEVAQKTLDKFDPINASGLAFTTAVNKLAADDYATKLYQEIIKPSNSIPQDTKSQIINHMLETGVTPDMRGANNAQARISDALAQSDELIEGSTETMPASDMLGYYEGQANPSQQTIDMDASAIARAKAAQARIDQMEPHFSPVGEEGPVYRPDLTAEQVRGQRRTADDQVKYDKGGRANTSSDAAKLNKGQADYLRETLGEMVQEIQPLNRQISMDIPAKEFAELAAQKAGNNNTIGLGAKVMGAGNLAKGLLMMVADNPANKARVARYVHGAKNNPLMMRDAPLLNTGRNLLQFEGRQGEYVAELLREEEERRKREEGR